MVHARRPEVIRSVARVAAETAVRDRGESAAATAVELPETASADEARMTRWQARDRTIQEAADPIPRSWESSTSRPTASPTAAARVPAAVEHARDLALRGCRPARPGGRVEPAGLEPGAPRRGAQPASCPWSKSAGIRGRSSRSRSTRPRPRSPSWRSRRGASIINDITAMRGDPEMARVVADSGAGVVLMHMLGTPRPCRSTRDTRTWSSEVLTTSLPVASPGASRGASRGRGSPSTRASASARRFAT